MFPHMGVGPFRSHGGSPSSVKPWWLGLQGSPQSPGGRPNAGSSLAEALLVRDVGPNVSLCSDQWWVTGFNFKKTCPFRLMEHLKYMFYKWLGILGILKWHVFICVLGILGWSIMITYLEGCLSFLSSIHISWEKIALSWLINWQVNACFIRWVAAIVEVYNTL